MKNEPPFDILYALGIALWIVSGSLLAALVIFGTR